MTQHKSDTMLPLTIAEKNYEWDQQYITGLQIKNLAGVPKDSKILLTIKRPWEDEVIDDETQVDLAREGIEHFLVRPKHEEFLVEIHINDDRHEIKRGKHKVSELRRIGNVPSTHIFAELIGKELIDLENNADVLIKGCEQFYSHIPDGCSS